VDATHVVASVDVLGADGTVETITGTTIHPVWSVDRQEWVPLAELTDGETLQGLDGLAVVLSVSLSRVSQPVYNIEVHGEHVYQVGELGLVVHNVKGGLRAPVNAAGGFKGRKGFELVNHPLQPVRSVATTINGRRFSGHALDQMQNRGIPPSVVQNAIEHGISSLGNKPGTQIFTDMVNKIRVVINSTTGNVITVILGI